MEYNKFTINRIIVATMLVHNFLIEFEQAHYIRNNRVTASENGSGDISRDESQTFTNRSEVSEWRDKIAQTMWNTSHRG